MKSYEEQTHKEAREYAAAGGRYRYCRPEENGVGERVFGAGGIPEEPGLHFMSMRDEKGVLLSHLSVGSLEELAVVMSQEAPLFEWFAEEG